MTYALGHIDRERIKRNHPANCPRITLVEPITAEPEPMNPLYYIEHDQEPPSLLSFIERNQDGTNKEKA